MKKRLLIWLLILLGIGPVMGQVYQVGDLYTAPDGSQGIVFYVHPDGSGGWIVALNDASSGCKWGPNVNVPELDNQNPTYRQLLLGDIDGYANTVAMRSTALASGGGTYASTVVDLAREWVVPSPAQLRVLYGQLSVVSPALIAAGGQDMARANYWTSAERNYQYAWYIDFGEAAYAGSFMNALKSSEYRVREVRSFTILTIDYDTTLTYAWNTGATTPYIVVAPTETANYTVTATSAYGCSNTATQTVTVANDAPVTLYDVTCQGAGYNRNGFELSAEETAEVGELVRERYESVSFCTTPVTLHLTVNPVVTNSTTITVCEGESVTLQADCLSEGAPIFSEGFSSVTMGSDASGSGSGTKLQDNEVTNFPDCDEDHVFRAGGHLRFGDVSSGGGGYITSIPMDLSHPFTVKLWVRGWNNAAENPWFYLNVDNDTVMRQSIPVSAWDASYVEYDYSSSMGATANSRITIGNTTLHQRFFLDSVAVVSRTECQYAWNTGESTASITITPNTTATYYVTVTPAGGCPRIDTFYVVVSPRPVVTLDPCNGTCDSASLTVDCHQGALLPPAIPCANGYEFAGWTNEPANSVVTTLPSPLYLAGEYFLSSTDDTLYAVYRKCTYSDTVYRKVTASLSDWSGNYLIAYTDGNMIFDGSLATLDAVNNYQTVSITSNTIPATGNLAKSFTIAQTGSNYTIRSASGKYIGRTANSNGLNEGNTQYTNSISYSSGNINIIGSGGAYLRFNNSSDQKRFRYYKSDSYTSQKPIQLYKYESLITCEYTSYPFYPSSSLTESVCETYTWTSGNGESYTESGTYYFEHSNANGCPQVDTLYLTVLHENAATVTFVPGNGYCASASLTEEDCRDGVILPTATSCSSDYVFAGWSTTAVDTNTTTTPSPLYSAGTNYNPSEDITLYAVYKKCTSSDTLFTLVTTSLDDWSGEYLIVSTGGNTIFNGALNPPNVIQNQIESIVIDNTHNRIFPPDNSGVDLTSSTFLITSLGSNNYSIKSKSGYFIGRVASSQGIDTSSIMPFNNTITYSNNANHDIFISSNGLELQTSFANGKAYRYWPSTKFPIQLYRLELDEDCEYTTFPPNPSSDTNAIACRSYTWHGHTYTESGDYNDTLTNALGCDSVVTLHLTLHNPTITFDDTDPLTVCAGEDVVLHAYAHGNYEINYTWNFPDGHSLGWFDSLVIYNVNASDAGTYEVNASSTIFLSYSPLVYCMTSAVKSFTVTVNTPVHEHFSEVACESYTWHWLGGGDTTITESGDYTHSHEDINGCTQVDTLHLTINRSIVVDTTVVVCDSFSWNGNTYMWSGNYSDTLTNGLGCDSVVTLHLTINESPNLTITATADTICAGESDTLWVMRSIVPLVAVGDILCTDNSIVKPEDWPVAGKNAQGVVFYVDNTGQHGWVVNLQDQDFHRWAGSSTIGANTDISTMNNYATARDAMNDLDGYANTQRIREAGDASLYPAAFAVDFDHGWYLPAVGQLRILYAELYNIYESIQTVNGDPFVITNDTGWYWSSTEYDSEKTWLVLYTFGSVAYETKTNLRRVRSVKNF